MVRSADPIRRPQLTCAARAFGLSQLREDPGRFTSLLEKIIGDNPGYFFPDAPPQNLSNEVRKLHGRRLEALIDDAVRLASALYPGRRRDRALLSIAQHAERLMKRIWEEPFARGGACIVGLGRKTPTDFGKVWGSLSIVRECATFCEETS